MGIVSAEQLNRFMSSPRWAQPQEHAAQELLNAVEGSLAAALNTWISPPDDPLREHVEVSDTSGLVMCTHPVHTVLDVAGAAPVDPATAPPGYTLRGRRLYADEPPTSSAPSTFNLAAGWGGQDGRGGYLRRVWVTYLPGWGEQAALYDAIVERAATRFDNRHDDTITIRDDTPTRTSPTPDKGWNADQLRALNRFRVIGIIG